MPKLLQLLKTLGEFFKKMLMNQIRRFTTVVNGRLRHAIGLDSSAYSSFSSLNQNYFRIFTPNAPRESGRIEWSCDSNLGQPRNVSIQQKGVTHW